MSDSIETSTGETVLSFGSFRLYPSRKLLMDGERRVQIGSRAIDMLIALTEHPGDLVSTDHLLRQVWPNTVVDENSVRVHMSTLRKALAQGSSETGSQIVANVAGRGYRFMLDVERSAAVAMPRQTSPRSIAVAAAPGLPMRLTRLIGRSNAIHDIEKLLQTQRMVSLVGPGGIGKTAVALAVAESQNGQYDGGVYFIDLAPIDDPSLVPNALALALGISISASDPAASLLVFLRESRALLILDNCEHVIESVAMLAERLLSMAPKLRILATSREALCTAGEWVYRLKALDIPGDEIGFDAAALMQFSAVQLFVERASANASGFEVSHTTLVLIASICRQLDGIPLAIELAAARAEGLGVEGLIARFAEILELLTRGRRIARPRHQTLVALLDWSVELLTEPELMVLRRLSVFHSGFTTACAAMVCSCDRISGNDVVDIVMVLSAKSLVSSDQTHEFFQHRLLNTTRLYALQRLKDSGEFPAIAHRHARFVLGLLKQAQSDMALIDQRLWRSRYLRVADEFRSALDWAFSESGDEDFGVELTLAGHYPAIELIILEEYQGRIDQALARLDASDTARPELKIRLHSARASVNVLMLGSRSEQESTGKRLCELAGNEAGRTSESLYIAAVASFAAGDYPALLKMAGASLDLSLEQHDEVGRSHANRLLSYAYHHLGRHDEAKKLVLRALAVPVKERKAHFISQVPFALSMRMFLARILWIQGAPDEAMRVTREVVDLSAGGHPYAISQTLACCAVPIALWSGDESQAAAWNAVLIGLAKRHSIEYWHSWGREFQKVIDGRSASGRQSNATCAYPDEKFSPGLKVLDMLATLEPESIHELTWQRVNDAVVGWCAPEVMRMRGEHVLAGGGARSVLLAQELFLSGFELAQKQGAIAWQLRCATSLLTGWCGTRRMQEGVALLNGVLGQIQGGAGTRDVERAQALLIRCQEKKLRKEHT